MSEPLPSAASSALDELLDVSPQVDAAVILRRGEDDARLVASAPASSDHMAERFGDTCVRILAAAERAREELGREPISQVEIATGDGHVFVVADATWIVAAVTAADPTVGLVFYDLKTALRSVREDGTGDDAPAAAATPLVVEAAGEPAPVPADAPAEDADDDADSTASRWRRRKS